VNLAPAVRHGCCSAGLACPLGSSTAARARAQEVRAQEVHRSFLTIPPPRNRSEADMPRAAGVRRSDVTDPELPNEADFATSFATNSSVAVHLTQSELRGAN